MGQQPDRPREAPTHAGPIRVVILDDHVLFGEAMEIALRASGHEILRPLVPTDGGSMQLTIAAITRFEPDVALVDLDLGRAGNGVAVIEALIDTTPVVALTGSTDRFRWAEALYHGATTVIGKMRPLDDIVTTIRRVSAGLPVLADADRERLVRRWIEREQEHGALRERLGRLTERERDVLYHLTQGRTVSEIAAIRTVAEATVRTQVKSLLAKLEVSSQIAAVGIAHQTGWGRNSAEQRPQQPGPAGPHS
jgi:two-component system nitrate/nitrite response regulator NarL